MTRLVPIRFAIFVTVVLALPAALMAQADPRLVELGKLAMILSPGLAGIVLSLGLGGAKQSTRWPWVALAAIMTLAIAGCALGVAFAAGAASFRPTGVSVSGLLVVASGSALTSVLEELGWAGGGLALADRTLGPRWGVVVLGLVWAAWHLIPVAFDVGLFPYLEAGPPGMIAAFVVACIIYRFLLTHLRRSAGTWVAAAAGHAAPNIVLASLMAAGVGGFGEAAWWWFPAPGGLAFPLFAAVALVLLLRLHPRQAGTQRAPA